MIRKNTENLQQTANIILKELDTVVDEPKKEILIRQMDIIIMQISICLFADLKRDQFEENRRNEALTKKFVEKVQSDHTSIMPLLFKGGSALVTILGAGFMGYGAFGPQHNWSSGIGSTCDMVGRGTGVGGQFFESFVPMTYDNYNVEKTKMQRQDGGEAKREELSMQNRIMQVLQEFQRNEHQTMSVFTSTS